MYKRQEESGGEPEALSENAFEISVWRTIHDFHVLRFIFKIIFEMKYFHRNYVFLLIASALTTVLRSLTYTCLLYTSASQSLTGKRYGVLVVVVLNFLLVCVFAITVCVRLSLVTRIIHCDSFN